MEKFLKFRRRPCARSAANKGGLLGGMREIYTKESAIRVRKKLSHYITQIQNIKLIAALAFGLINLIRQNSGWKLTLRGVS
jgi:hypothetical protein